MESPTTGAEAPQKGANMLARNKQLITGILIVVVLGALLFLNSQDATAPTSDAQPESAVTLQTETATPKGPSTLTALLAQNIPQECTFSTKTDGTESYGTVYLANGKMRVDAQVRTAGTLTKSSMINDGTYVYVWGDEMEGGVKMLVPDTAANAQAPKGPAQVIDPNAEQAYNCTPNIPDPRSFTPPTSVTFTDLSAMLPGAGKGAPAADSVSALKATQCAACAQAGEDAAACRQALGCAE